MPTIEDVLGSDSNASDIRQFGFKVVDMKGQVHEGIYSDTCLTKVLNRLNENFGELTYCYVEELPEEMGGMTLL